MLRRAGPIGVWQSGPAGVRWQLFRDEGTRVQFSGDILDVAKGLGRAFGGALLVGLPALLMTERWALGVVIPRERLALLVVVTMLLVGGLSHHFGFRRGERIGAVGAAFEGVTAFAVGLVTAAVVLTIMSVVNPLASWGASLSVIAIQAPPGAVGASFARRQLGQGGQRTHQRNSYHQELLVMTAGAVVFSASIAPAEEVVLLGARMNPAGGLILVGFTLVVMHAFVYVLEFKGGQDTPESLGLTFLVFTGGAYVVALAVSAYLLWTFGRYGGTGLEARVMEMVVLALPAGIGAAAARLVV